jgi:hypothetical protein
MSVFGAVSLESTSSQAWSRTLIALSRASNIDSDTRRQLKRTLLAHAADLTAALVLLLQRGDVDDFVHTTSRVLRVVSSSSSSSSTVPVVDESVWRAFAANLVEQPVTGDRTAPAGAACE